MKHLSVAALFSVWHLCAISLTSLPPPLEAEDAPPTASRAEGEPSTIRSFFDTADDVRVETTKWIWAATGALRRAARVYTRMIALEQRWNMFSEPPDTDQYVRMRYYTRASAAKELVLVDRELVYPNEREDRVRPFNRSHHREKAIRNARQQFARGLRDLESVSKIDQLPRQLIPLLRFYASRYEFQLPPGESLERVEIWLGYADIPPPGEDASELLATRMNVLRTYYDDVGTTWARGGPPAIGTTDREGDIAWTLVYFLPWP